MTLLKATAIEKSFGDRRVLREASVSVAAGEAVGLVGINGGGKSTFLKICAGLYEADFGEVEVSGRIAILDQEPKLPGLTVGQAADDALGWHRRLLRDFEAASIAEDMDAMSELQAQLDDRGWTVDHRVDAMLLRLGCAPRDALVADLSGGERRRVALARALLEEPDVLLLDEPTNHLDIETIGWLQGHLEAFKGAVLIVTHDRYLLEAVATKIVEVEDGVSVMYPGSYGDYLVARAERQAALMKAEDSRLALIRREAAWAAKSPSARRTKSKARLQRLDALQAKRPLKKDETFKLDLSTGARSGSTLLEIHGLTHGYDGRTLIDNLDISLPRGERLGILGPNGAGKSTLLRLIAGTEKAQAGEVVLGGRVKIAWLDQHRTGLKETDTVWEAAGGGNTYVTVGDKPVHVAGFLGRFLFKRQQIDQPVSVLSGGERARLLLARLLLEGRNLLLLDEPTNDLDLLTLRVLEEALMAFDGSALIVTHDRAFLDRVCTSVLHFEGDGKVVSYHSRQQVEAAQSRRANSNAPAASASSSKATRKPKPKKAGLSYKERQEFEGLEGKIAALEAEFKTVEAALADPATYRARADEVPALTARFEELPGVIEAAYARWEVLEARATS
jgi:ABC transport system ATP-binding/permease protein